MKDNIEALLSSRNLLLKELESITRKIEDAQTEVYRHTASEKAFVQRYFSGDRIIVSFGWHWWINQDGDLLGIVDETDIDELKRLVISGVFEKVTIHKPTF